jgi:hypothetical protein
MTLLTSYYKYFMMDIQLEVHTMSNHKSTESKNTHIMDDGTRQEAPSNWMLAFIVTAIVICAVLS